MVKVEMRFGRRLSLPSTLQIKREIMLMHELSQKARELAITEHDGLVELRATEQALDDVRSANAETAMDGPPSPARAMRSMERAFLRNNP